jgi:glutamyl-tRNA synthetase
MASSFRVRYAPSPTGEPHLGNIRSALFNWLFARSVGGTFIVRIEDTDQARLVPGATDAILDALRWLGLDWDEGPKAGGDHGPYVQSDRKAMGLYQEHVDWLIAEKKAYYCFCTPEDLDAMRKEQMALGASPRYDRRHRDISEEEVAEGFKMNPNPVVRFKMPLGGQITVDDIVRGMVTFEAGLLDDFVLLKSDGFPTYHLANIVDDHLMEISHVMRAEEWLPSAPRHKELYAAFGYEMPLLAHLPIILGPDRSKLSKRHGSTSVLHYRDIGYLPDAMVNYLALLGWSLDDRTDVISREDLVKHFSIERIVASPAVFNIEKLDWFNGLYIREMPLDQLCAALVPYLEAAESGLPASVARPLDVDYLMRILPLERERLKMLAQAPEMLKFFFEEQPELDAQMLVQKGMDLDSTRVALEASLTVAEGSDPFDADPMEQRYRELADQLSLKTGQLFGTLRVATTARSAAPPLFATMAVLGKERCLARMRHALDALDSIPTAG